jgi:hypothetical protein
MPVRIGRDIYRRENARCQVSAEMVNPCGRSWSVATWSRRTTRPAMLGTVGWRPGFRRLTVSHFFEASSRCRAQECRGLREDLAPAPARYELCKGGGPGLSAGSYQVLPTCRRSAAFSCRSTRSSASFARSLRNTRTARPSNRRSAGRRLEQRPASQPSPCAACRQQRRSPSRSSIPPRPRLARALVRVPVIRVLRCGLAQAAVCGDVHPVTEAGLLARFSMKICRLAGHLRQLYLIDIMWMFPHIEVAISPGQCRAV